MFYDELDQFSDEIQPDPVKLFDEETGNEDFDPWVYGLGYDDGLRAKRCESTAGSYYTGYKDGQIAREHSIPK